ncbi:hypothetical protein D3C76_1849280 [compost metagenome]
MAKPTRQQVEAVVIDKDFVVRKHQRLDGDPRFTHVAGQAVKGRQFFREFLGEDAQRLIWRRCYEI